MRVWFDAPAARDLLFLEGAVSRVARRHETLLTTSGDPTALAVSRARRLGARRAGGPAAASAAHSPAGRAGDGKGSAAAWKRSRLDARVSRLGPLARLASGFSPDLAVSVSSAEAARAAFGLAVPHVAFGMDEPGDDELARLTAPLVQKMIIPRHAPAAPLVRRGLAAADIVRFRGTIASATARRKPAPAEGGAKRRLQQRAVSAAEGYVLARPPADGGAAWAKEVAEAVLGGRRLAMVAVLPRPGQARGLRSSLGIAARVIAGGVHDGMPLLGACRAFVGAAGSTMASEAALCGVPAVAYGPGAGGARADATGESRLVRLRLLSRASTAAGLRARIGTLLSAGPGARARARARARAELSSMEEPFAALSRAARAAGARL